MKQEGNYEVNKVGIPLIGKDGHRQMKRGCDSCSCPPPAVSTPYPAKRKEGVTGANLPE